MDSSRAGSERKEYEHSMFVEAWLGQLAAARWPARAAACAERVRDVLDIQYESQTVQREGVPQPRRAPPEPPYLALLVT